MDDLFLLLKFLKEIDIKGVSGMIKFLLEAVWVDYGSKKKLSSAWDFANELS